ncbi:PaaI family thioesterase [uncultured Erythrobacter sp.]|uniref:PaaI family thioesterase n=1 Tax=uncultured Erythrobacter sp. TaxID=263913 RepID=UPI0026587DB1|nr:PaaI family thioesterase [uncultured Erythrobacter sp.]
MRSPRETPFYYPNHRLTAAVEGSRSSRYPAAPSTVTLTVNYLSGARLGDWLEARVRIDRLGGRTAYTSGGVWRGDEQIATMSGVFAFRR